MKSKTPSRYFPGYLKLSVDPLAPEGQIAPGPYVAIQVLPPHESGTWKLLPNWRLKRQLSFTLDQ